MARKLHKFQTEAEYQAYSASTEYTTPCVAVVEENNVIYYDYGNNKPQPNYTDYKVSSRSLVSDGGDTYGLGEKLCLNYIPSSVTSLERAFSKWSSLEEVTCKIPDGVTNMNNTFGSCTSLVNAPVIPSSVTNMNNTFYGCTSIVNAPKIPSGVTDMEYTFGGCTSLVNAPEIPSGVTNMNYTFYGCTSLKEVTFLHTTPPRYNNALYGCSKLETIYVPDSAVSAYKTATGWSQFASKIKPLSEKPSE